MEAGPFLDALVAQMVFGHTILGFKDCEYTEWGYWVVESDNPWALIYLRPVRLVGCLCDDDDVHTFYRPMGHKEECLEVVPCYSTVITDAWKVIEYFPSLSLQKYTFGHPDATQETCWQAWTQVCPAGLDDPMWSVCSKTYAFADTAPLAICLAALTHVDARPLHKDCCGLICDRTGPVYQKMLEEERSED